MQISAATVSIWLGNLFVAALTFAAMYLMNTKEIGKGAIAMFAIPVSLMVVAMFEVCYLILTDEKSNKIKWIALIPFAVVSLCGFLYAYNF